MVKKKSKFRHISINKKSFIFMRLSGGIFLGDSGHAGIKRI